MSDGEDRPGLTLVHDEPKPRPEPKLHKARLRVCTWGLEIPHDFQEISNANQPRMVNNPSDVTLNGRLLIPGRDYRLAFRDHDHRPRAIKGWRYCLVIFSEAMWARHPELTRRGKSHGGIEWNPKAEADYSVLVEGSVHRGDIGPSPVLPGGQQGGEWVSLHRWHAWIDGKGKAHDCVETIVRGFRVTGIRA
jgi:hypothetical protein